MRTGRLNSWFDVGEWDRIPAEGALVAERLEAGGMIVGLIWLRIAMGRRYLWGGDVEAAAPLIEWSLEAARNAGGADEKPVALSLAALGRLRGGDADQARQLLLELERMGYRDNQNYAGNLPEMVRTALAIDDIGLAERLSAGVVPSYPLHENAVMTVRALLAEARGEDEEGAQLFAMTAARWESFGDVWERSLALMGQGRCLVRQHDLRAASEPVAAAHDAFVRLGAKPAMTEAEALLERIAAKPS
jgi:hypothetical protein